MDTRSQNWSPSMRCECGLVSALVFWAGRRVSPWPFTVHSASTLSLPDLTPGRLEIMSFWLLESLKSWSKEKQLKVTMTWTITLNRNHRGDWVAGWLQPANSHPSFQVPLSAQNVVEEGWGALLCTLAWCVIYQLVSLTTPDCVPMTNLRSCCDFCLAWCYFCLEKSGCTLQPHSLLHTPADMAETGSASLVAKS